MISWWRLRRRLRLMYWGLCDLVDFWFEGMSEEGCTVRRVSCCRGHWYGEIVVGVSYRLGCVDG